MMLIYGKLIYRVPWSRGTVDKKVRTVHFVSWIFRENLSFLRKIIYSEQGCPIDPR
ncbi:hypothetical protein PITCH_A2080006 [uncultured Desulfobacterium sp.]|uniref:Uncharacterized protein n=1 Tax=uncultured Desulfobacterium sp. TaxID=201089 RepID=A0A445MXF6_9BACT|nr:hypothetical protein PITCH_A2080006 [uncultured Desulfobacterium sp.]